MFHQYNLNEWAAGMGAPVTYLERALTQGCEDDRRGTISVIPAINTADLDVRWDQSGFTAHMV